MKKLLLLLFTLCIRFESIDASELTLDLSMIPNHSSNVSTSEHISLLESVKNEKENAALAAVWKDKEKEGIAALSITLQDKINKTIKLKATCCCFYSYTAIFDHEKQTVSTKTKSDGIIIKNYDAMRIFLNKLHNGTLNATHKKQDSSYFSLADNIYLLKTESPSNNGMHHSDNGKRRNSDSKSSNSATPLSNTSSSSSPKSQSSDTYQQLPDAL